MRKILSLLCLTLLSCTAIAIPAKREWRSVTQPDGSQLNVMLVGDENYHYYTTSDGAVLLQENGAYYYACEQEDGYLGCTDMLAHEADRRSEAEVQLLADMPTTDRTAVLRKKVPQRTQPGHVGTPTGVFEGSKKGIIILVSFDDLDFSVENPQETFGQLVNQPGYTNSLGAIGSVHDYFYDMSGGRFDLTFDVVGPYKAPQGYAYYGKNNGNRTDVSVTTLIKWAMKAADEDVNYTDYDWDGDGYVDQVFILYAGYGEAQGAPAETIWPHESQLRYSFNEVQCDNVWLNTYACGQELAGSEGQELAGIGTICHEFTHCLGLPDFYDTDGNSGATDTGYGMSSYDLMCSGSYNGNSWKPAAYTGYERNFCGWLDYDELTDPCRVTDQAPIEDGGNVFVVYNPATENEYYLFEHRNRMSGWDQGLGGNGLLIYHVNYMPRRWRDNTVNNKSAGVPGMEVVAADNSYVSYLPGDVIKDLWPSVVGIKTVNEFSDETTPACVLYNDNTDGTNLLHIKLSRIKYNNRNRTVSFTFNDGTAPYGNGIADLSVTPVVDDGAVYSLSGQRVADSYRGLVIANGRKVIR